MGVSSQVDGLVTIKLEDLEQSTPAPADNTPADVSLSLGAYLESMGHPTGSTATPSTTASKPVKKRKSWGQVLPEPKTNLPPRKRAKTADEKEQRRIERVRRNRLAAHNSRERKRLEVERLQADKMALERHAAQLVSLLRQVEDENAELRSKCGMPASERKPLPVVETTFQAPFGGPLGTPESLSMSIDSPADTSDHPATPLMESLPAPPTSTPSSSASIISPALDKTQHSAAMLCGLQCRSTLAQLLRMRCTEWSLGMTISKFWRSYLTMK